MELLKFQCGTDIAYKLNQLNKTHKSIMTARELIKILESVEPDKEVYFLPNNSYYPESFGEEEPEEREIRSFWGKNFTGVIIRSDGQVGSV